MSEAAQQPTPSATVVVIRDADGLEVLLLERTRGRGSWVFPGGKIDASDGPLDGESWEPTARRAAVREAHEEAAIVLDARALLPLSRWITPDMAPRRFDTLFFLARVGPDVDVRPDGSEMRSHRWWSPEGALDAHHRDEISLAPPTFVTISSLLGHSRCDDVVNALVEAERITFRPHICKDSSGRTCILYPGDAGYQKSAPDRAGARHRLWVLSDGWRYERDRAGSP